MKKTPLMMIAALTLTACGSDDGNNSSPNNIQVNNAQQNNTPDVNKVDPKVNCKGDYCGESRFVAAVPTTNTVHINFGSNQQALAEIAPAYLATDEHISEINDTVDEVFGVIEEIASLEPTTAEEGLHLWEGDVDGVDFSLEISTDDNQTYDFELDLVDDIEDAGVSGTVVLNEDEEKESFEFTIDYAALGDFGDEIDGTMLIRATPSDFGVWEIVYDIELNTDETSEFETTTYWAIDGVAGAIEYSYDGDSLEESLSGDVYVVWNENGGRFDSLLTGDTTEFGAFEQLETECWDSVGGQTFAAAAVFSESGDYGEIDGEETDCEFGFEDAHPDLDSTIIIFFDDESWEEYGALDDIPGENNLNNLNNANNVNNVNNDQACLAAADVFNDALIFCDFEPENVDDLCLDPDATIACADALDIAEDVCVELDSNPDCF